jgi:hypothetical protein
MIEVKCEGGECDGLTVKIDPMPIVYEVVDPRDRSRRDYYVLQPPSAEGPAKLVVSSPTGREPGPGTSPTT